MRKIFFCLWSVDAVATIFKTLRPKNIEFHSVSSNVNQAAIILMVLKTMVATNKIVLIS